MKLKMTRHELTNDIKGYLDNCYFEDWHKKYKVPWYRVAKQPTNYSIRYTQGSWWIHSIKKTKTLIWYVNGSNEFADYFSIQGNFNCFNVPISSRSIPITTKIKTKAEVCLGWKMAAKDLQPYMRTIIDRECPTTLKVIAQSRGCPIAQINAEKFAFYYAPHGMKVKGIYLSSPRAGNQAFADLHDAQVKSIMLYIVGDVVCLMPPWNAQIKNVKGWWSWGWPPIVYPHLPMSILKELQRDTKWIPSAV